MRDQCVCSVEQWIAWHGMGMAACMSLYMSRMYSTYVNGSTRERGMWNMRKGKEEAHRLPMFDDSWPWKGEDDDGGKNGGANKFSGP